MESVRKARSRLQKYPALIASCSVQAAAYGRCVALYMGDVQKDQCVEEFQAFKKCIIEAAKKANTKV